MVSLWSALSSHCMTLGDHMSDRYPYADQATRATAAAHATMPPAQAVAALRTARPELSLRALTSDGFTAALLPTPACVPLPLPAAAPAAPAPAALAAAAELPWPEDDEDATSARPDSETVLSSTLVAMYTFFRNESALQPSLDRHVPERLEHLD